MKVLHISGAKGWGGNEQQMIYLFPELEKINVQNIVFGIKDSVLQSECAKLKIPFIAAKNKKLKGFAEFFYIKKIISNEKPDVVHLHTSNSLTFFTIAAFIFKLKTKAVFSKKSMANSSSFLSKLKYNSKNINSIICVSTSVQKNLERFLSTTTKQKTVVIHDCVSLSIENAEAPINLRKLYDIPENVKIIGNIANHFDAKDIPTLVNVVNEIINRQKRKNVVFIQVGEWTKHTINFKELVKQNHLEENILFTDKIPFASSIIKQFDLFLMTSQREGGPTSVLEAMFIGVPVVSTKVGVVPDVIVDGQNGFSANVKDFQQLSDKIIQLLDSSNLQSAFVEKSKNIIINNFSASIIASQTKEEYLRIISI